MLKKCTTCFTAHDAALGNMVTIVGVGEIHTGTVYGISSEFISVDIGYRELIYVKYDKEPAAIQALKPGEETSVLITSTDNNSHVVGSINGGIKHRVFMDLREAV